MSVINMQFLFQTDGGSVFKDNRKARGFFFFVC